MPDYKKQTGVHSYLVITMVVGDVQYVCIDILRYLQCDAAMLAHQSFCLEQSV